MGMKNFIAKYTLNGVERTIQFDGSRFDKTKAEQLLAANDIKDFFFFFEPSEYKDLPDGSLLISGEIGFDITLERLMPYLNDGRKLVIDSPGGSLYEAYKVYDYIKQFADDVEISVLGMAASAATIILAASKNRGGSLNSRFLIHNPWTFAVGDANDMRIKSEELRVEEDNIIRIYSELFGKSAEEIKALMKPEKFMTSDEALALNLITKINGTGEPAKVESVINNENENKNDETMDKVKAKKSLDVLAKAFNDIKSFFSPSNLLLQDVNGVELDFGADVTSEEQIVVGITGVTANGEPAQGDYTMPNGSVLRFTAGTLDEIVAPVDNSEVEQLTAENSALKTEIENLKKENETLAKKNSETFAKMTDLEKKFNDFKNEFSKEDSVPVDGGAANQNQNSTTKQKFYYKPKSK